MDIEHLAHDLFLLMLNLSQVKSVERILVIFLEAMNRAQTYVHLRRRHQDEPISSSMVEIATAQHTFGWLVLEGDGMAHPEEVLSLIRNAVGMLAIILENRAQAQMLADDRARLEDAVRQRTVELLHANVQLESEITERKRMEGALRESEALYRHAIEVIGAVPYYQTYDPNVYTFMGEGIRQLSGYGPEEMTPELWHSLIQESIMLGAAAGMDRHAASTLARRGRLLIWKSDDCIRARDGQLRWVMDSAVEILNDQGVSESSLGILQDVTWRKRTEEALRESNRRLEDALAELCETQERVVHQERLAAVGQLAAGIAHDFNNILASIVLYTQMSLRIPNLPPKLQQRLEIIAQQSDRAADLVQQILDFGRRAVLERQPLSLDSFLKEVVKLLQRTLPENIQINLTFGPDDYLILADPTRIQQVIVNLALNARDAMPKGGAIHITLSRGVDAEIHCVDCGVIVGGEWIEVAVADSGDGIPPDVLPHIFEPFFTTRAPLGHGLGLPQVHGLVSQHGGHIEVESQVGSGTTFRLYLPALSVPPVHTEAREPVEVIPGHGETILVVEDDAMTRSALVDVLRVLEYQVISAADGAEALMLCEQHADTIALVVSDWVMPVMGGLELVRALKARAPALKVLLLTGHPLAEETRTDVPDNVVGWILKPPSMTELAQEVSRSLNPPESA